MHWTIISYFPLSLLRDAMSDDCFAQEKCLFLPSAYLYFAYGLQPHQTVFSSGLEIGKTDPGFVGASSLRASSLLALSLSSIGAGFASAGSWRLAGPYQRWH